MLYRQVSSPPHAQRSPATRASAPHAAGYTLAHAGQQVRVGPVAFWIVTGTLVIMASWSVVTATYFAFRDDVLTGLIARHADVQYAYEDRIAELRAQVDRLSSRQLLNQEQYEQRLEQIIRRQSALESRANALLTLPDSITTGSIRPPSREQTRSAPNRPANDKSSDLRLPERTPGRDINIAATLTRLQSSLDRIETQQTASLASMEQAYEARAHRIRGVFTDLGIDATRSNTNTAIGGPLVAARLPANAGSFEQHIHRVGIARAQVDRLTRALETLPLRIPVLSEPDISSGFGMRIDPFTRAPAMHTGMDFRGDPGDPVRATAEGHVTMAGANGGYGNMIEIDHGNGVATRYAHLSDIGVKIGQRVRAGQIIGKIGSTGRSTGPHLHYETRVGGDVTDPRKFLRASMRLGGVR